LRCTQKVDSLHSDSETCMTYGPQYFSEFLTPLKSNRLAESTQARDFHWVTLVTHHTFDCLK
jgi:hypothetical protein